MWFVVSTDGSDQSIAALHYALEIADAMGATVTAVYAVEPNVREREASDPVTGVEDAKNRLVIENVEDVERRGRQVLDDAVEIASEYEIELQTELVYGDPIDAIPRFAERNDADGIFAGHRDVAKDHQQVLGSVAKGLVDRSSVPVTIVR
jgi:nucleotide-binding universal stress UspA family protein